MTVLAYLAVIALLLIGGAITVWLVHRQLEQPPDRITNEHLPEPHSQDEWERRAASSNQLSKRRRGL